LTGNWQSFVGGFTKRKRNPSLQLQNIISLIKTFHFDICFSQGVSGGDPITFIFNLVVDAEMPNVPVAKNPAQLKIRIYRFGLWCNRQLFDSRNRRADCLCPRRKKGITLSKKGRDAHEHKEHGFHQNRILNFNC